MGYLTGIYFEPRKIYVANTVNNDDKLIELKHLDTVLPGIYKHGNFLLFAYTYLSRNCPLSNSLNYDFLFRLKEHCEIVVRIHLDLNLIGLKLEHSCWWRSHFTEEFKKARFQLCTCMSCNTRKPL